VPDHRLRILTPGTPSDADRDAGLVVASYLMPDGTTVTIMRNPRGHMAFTERVFAAYFATAREALLAVSTGERFIAPLHHLPPLPESP
jgi:hypothetical protein